MCDIQKASILKRISAYILDVILFAIIAVGIGSLMSVILAYDSNNDKLTGIYNKYETQYGIKFDISVDEYEKYTEAERENYNKAYEALVNDAEAIYTYNLVINLTLVITSVSILIAYIILEFIVPVILKNGQTVGKKIFGIALVRADGVKVNNMMLFVRAVLGKYTIETMVPVLIIIMVFFNSVGIVGPIVLGAILLLEIILIIATRNNSLIHDLLAGTVAVDLASQMIFDSEEDLVEYTKKLHAERAARQDY